MPLPAVLLSIIIACLVASIFHIFVGGGRRRLLTFMVVACAGFFIGHFVGIWQGWWMFVVGALDIGIAVIFSILALVAFYLAEKINLRLKDDRV
jgi:hypothetical protein